MFTKKHMAMPNPQYHWVLKSKLVGGKISTKARLCIRVFKEIKKLEADLPTCSTEHTNCNHPYGII